MIFCPYLALLRKLLRVCPVFLNQFPDFSPLLVFFFFSLFWINALMNSASEELRWYDKYLQSIFPVESWLKFSHSTQHLSGNPLSEICIYHCCTVTKPINAEMLQDQALKTLFSRLWGDTTLSFHTPSQCYCLREWGGNELKTYFILQWKEGVVLSLSSVCGSTLFSSSLLPDCRCSTLTILSPQLHCFV